jgi:hypothetical protein
MLVTLGTFVENSHGLVSRTNLNLHEKGLIVITMRAISFRSVYILPRIIATPDISLNLLFQFRLTDMFLLNFAAIWASGTAKPIRISIMLLNQEYVATHRTK